MNTPLSNDPQPALTTKSFVDSMIRLGVIAIGAWLAFTVFRPFALIMLWGVILAVMIYPLHQKLAVRMGGKQGWSSTVLVLVATLSLAAPIVTLGLSFTEHIQEGVGSFQAGELNVPPPFEALRDLPIFGERIYNSWAAAASDLPAFVEQNSQQISELSRNALVVAGGLLGTVFLFIGAFIIAGIMMAWGKEGSGAMLRIFQRFAGHERGANLHKITVATVRSVASGVVGVAFIQAVLLGVGFVMADIPAPGILAVVALILGIIQIPALFVAIPAIVYIWFFGESVPINIMLTVYFLIAMLADNVLKPMLLGKGVPVPMPVVLIGALGGMMTAGLIGLFLGASLLAVAYRIFMEWVDDDEFMINDEPEIEAAAE